MPKTQYVARHNGEIIGTRSTDRTYTHAIAVVYDKTLARTDAYCRMPNNQDRRNFDYYASVAAEGRAHKHLSGTWHTDEYVAAEVAKAQAVIDGGFDAYAERLRQAAIASFEERKAAGAFEPCIVTWCGRPDLAQKEANKFRKEPRITHVAVIEVEKVIDTKKLKTCQPLTDHFNQSFGRKV